MAEYKTRVFCKFCGRTDYPKHHYPGQNVVGKLFLYLAFMPQFFTAPIYRMVLRGKKIDLCKYCDSTNIVPEAEPKPIDWSNLPE